MLTSVCNEIYDIWSFLDKKKNTSPTFKILENFLNNHIVIKIHRRQIITELSEA